MRGEREGGVGDEVRKARGVVRGGRGGKGEGGAQEGEEPDNQIRSMGVKGGLIGVRSPPNKKTSPFPTNKFKIKMTR